MSFRLASDPLDPGALRAALADARAGACVTFEGWVRNHNEGQAVLSLEYEAYAELAEQEGLQIITEARARFDVGTISAVHRIGHLQIGELAVWVGVTAAHRGAAFDGCRHVIDELKARVPIWKKEHYVSAPAQWVNCATRGDHADQH